MNLVDDRDAERRYSAPYPLLARLRDAAELQVTVELDFNQRRVIGRVQKVQGAPRPEVVVRDPLGEEVGMLELPFAMRVLAEEGL